MRTDQEDRYSSNNSKPSLLSKPSLSGKKLLTKKQWIILILAIVILLLLLSFALFKPEKHNNSETLPSQEANSTTHNEDDNNLQYTQLTPPKIAEHATETAQSTQGEERVEIPGEVTDLLTQKIEQLSKPIDGAMLSGQNRSTDKQYHELPLSDEIADDHFTIQLSASSSLENLLAFAKSNILTNYRIYETQRENKIWFVLIKGDYPSIKDAKAAIVSLPNNLQKNTPWVKSGATIKKEIAFK